MKLILYYCIIVCINKYRKFELMFRLDTDPTKFNGFGSNPTEVTDSGSEPNKVCKDGLYIQRSLVLLGFNGSLGLTIWKRSMILCA